MLQNTATDLAVMDIAELKVDFSQAKKSADMRCLVTLRNFVIEDCLALAHEEFNTTRYVYCWEGPLLRGFMVSAYFILIVFLFMVVQKVKVQENIF